VGEAESEEACGGEHQRFVLARGELAQAGVDIPAGVHDREVWPQFPNLAPAPGAARTNSRSRRELAQRTGAGDEHVAWIGAHREGGHHQIRGQL
jgi:hypothetical protein